MKRKPVLFDPVNDGVDHINVYSKGQTELGRLLSNFPHTPFEHPSYGNFASMEAYYYWLASGMRHDWLKPLYGFKAKEIGRGCDKVYCEHFDQLLYEGLECKVGQNDHIRILLTDSVLPLAHYYVYGGKPLDGGHSWLTDGLMDIRNRLKSES